MTIFLGALQLGMIVGVAIIFTGMKIVHSRPTVSHQILNRRLFLTGYGVTILCVVIYVCMGIHIRMTP